MTCTRRHPRSTRARALALAAGLATSLLAPASSAQDASPKPRDPAAADALFQSGTQALDRNDWETGCAKFRASMDLDPAVSTLLNIAKCIEHEGKLALAWSTYQQALVMNRGTQAEERRRELETYAREKLASLEPRLPKLRVVVRDPPAGLQVTRDGTPLPPASLGEAIPVDPGTVEVVATAPEHRPTSRKVTLKEGESTEVELRLERGADAASPTAEASSRKAGARDVASGPAATTAGPPAWAWVAAGTSVVAAAVGVGFMVDRGAAGSELETYCSSFDGSDPVDCDPAKRSEVEGLASRRDRDLGLFVGLSAVAVGGAAIAIVGFTRKPQGVAQTAGISAVPWVKPTAAGGSLAGRF